MKVTFLIARQMKDKVFKTIAISIALLQILLSELVCKAVFGSYVLFETSGSVGAGATSGRDEQSIK